MNEFQKKLKEYLNRKGLTAAEVTRLARKSGKQITEASLSYALRGEKTLSAETIEILAPVLSLSENEATGLTLLAYAGRSKNHGVVARLYQLAARCEGTLLGNHITDTIEVPVWSCIKAGTTDLQQDTSEAVGVTEMNAKERQRGCFCMRVCGKSMEGEQIFAGDIVFFQPLNGERVNERDTYAVEIEGLPCWVIKKIISLPGGKIGMVSADGSQPVEIDPAITGVSVKGVLIRTVREHRKSVSL